MARWKSTLRASITHNGKRSILWGESLEELAGLVPESYMGGEVKVYAQTGLAGRRLAGTVRSQVVCSLETW